MADGISGGRLQRLESRAVLQCGWQRVQHRQHVWASAARPRPAAGPVLAQIQVLTTARVSAFARKHSSRKILTAGNRPAMHGRLTCTTLCKKKSPHTKK